MRKQKWHFFDTLKSYLKTPSSSCWKLHELRQSNTYQCMWSPSIHKNILYKQLWYVRGVMSSKWLRVSHLLWWILWVSSFQSFKYQSYIYIYFFKYLKLKRSPANTEIVATMYSPQCWWKGPQTISRTLQQDSIVTFSEQLKQGDLIYGLSGLIQVFWSHALV